MKVYQAVADAFVTKGGMTVVRNNCGCAFLSQFPDKPLHGRRRYRKRVLMMHAAQHRFLGYERTHLQSMRRGL